jgi:hypothetical protein
MAVERERFVLGEDVDMAQVGVDAVGERDVDDAVVPAKRDCGLGTIAGERKESFSGSSGKQNSKCVSHVHLILSQFIKDEQFFGALEEVPESGTVSFPAA